MQAATGPAPQVEPPASRSSGSALAELYVVTDPPGADVSLDGENQGTSPILIKDVPVGRSIHVEARSGNRSASSDMALDKAGLHDVSLTLQAEKGNLIIMSTERAIRVALDGQLIGDLGNGLLRDIETGSHGIELSGSGLYWRGEATVVVGKTTEVRAEPFPVGEIGYDLPTGAEAVIVGVDTNQKVRSSGKLTNLRVGRYDISVSGSGIETQRLAVDLAKGQSYSLRPYMAAAPGPAPQPGDLVGGAALPPVAQWSPTPVVSSPRASSAAGAAGIPSAAQRIPASLHEAPMLADLVKAGKLPPVDRRLPKEPMVIGAGTLIAETDLKWEVGRYGGTERTERVGEAVDYGVVLQDNEPILYGSGMAQGVIAGNVVKSYEVSADQTTFTFRMREGMRWSDGQPVTSEDVRFAFEDVIFSKDLTPVFPVWLGSGNSTAGAQCVVDYPDQYTFRIRFSEPYGAFPTMLAGTLGWRGYTEILKPKHYLKQYHIKYTSLDRMSDEIKRLGFKQGEWWRLFDKKDVTSWEVATQEAAVFPSLAPWVCQSVSQQSVVMVRNAYYWKIDSAGNQLPYIDYVRSSRIPDPQTASPSIAAGEVDHSSDLATLSALPLYRANQARGGYSIGYYAALRAGADVCLNLTAGDPTWRKAARDVRFRRALNKAVKYRDIVDEVYSGLARAPYSVPGAYDPEGARELLDAVGLNKKDAQGFRLGPDGARFTIPIEIGNTSDAAAKVADIVAESWRAVGIDTTVRANDPALQSLRQAANEVKVSLQSPLRSDLWWGVWAGPWESSPLWQQWLNTGGAQGEEPPAEMKQACGLLQRMFVAGPQDRDALWAAFLRNLRENLWWSMTAEDIQYPVVASRNLANVPAGGFGVAAQSAAEQFFFRP